MLSYIVFLATLMVGATAVAAADASCGPLLIPDKVDGGHDSITASVIEVEIGFFPGEHMLFRVSYFGKSPKTTIALTNMRMIQISGTLVTSIAEIGQLVEVRHIRTGWFRWDKIEAVAKSGRVGSFDFGWGEDAEYFACMLRKLMRRAQYPQCPARPPPAAWA